MEQTFVMIKPDGVERGLVGDIISRFEKTGFSLKGLKLLTVERSFAEKHYQDLSGKPFFNGLVDYIISAPVVAMIWEGKNVVTIGREIIGVTNPIESAPGTIRGDFTIDIGRDVIHGSDSVESGRKEIALWFPDGPVSFRLLPTQSCGFGAQDVSFEERQAYEVRNLSLGVRQRLRNPRAETPVPYMGGILTGPMQSMGPQEVIKRGPDADRWQHGGNGQRKGLTSSLHTPLQMIHKAEKKHEVGKATDEEEAKQRRLKAIINKLTPQNFEELIEQVKAVNIDNGWTLSGFITHIFNKALMEPTLCEIYADFCQHLSGELPDFSEDNEKITFKGLLLSKCQEEFERGEREQEEADKADEEGEVKQTAEEKEENRVEARRRMLGNIRLIGELYKKKMLTERTMHECIQKLLGQYQTPDEEDVEALCKLMSTIGEIIDHPRAKESMDAYFKRMTMMSNNMKLSSRVRFMLKDAIDLRKNKWQKRRKVEGKKRIEEVHIDGPQERQQRASRLARNPTINSSARRVPMDFGTRGSTTLSSSNTQIGAFRPLPAQSRGFGAQDTRFEERQAYVVRTLSVPLPQRPFGDDSFTLGPQDGNRDVRNVDPPARAQGPGFSQNMPSDKVWPKEHLRDMSMAAIKEYYSARDDKEIALCIKDLNSPSFHPSMISLWVNDSLERKDIERDLLAKLLVKLTQSQDGLLSQSHLIKGFESVLSTLEDAVIDSPKAAEYLGRMFAKAVIENVISLGEIGQLLCEGGEPPGLLLEVGLAGDVLGSTLETIKSEKGYGVLDEIWNASNLRLADFIPSDPSGSRILHTFILTSFGHCRLLLY